MQAATTILLESAIISLLNVLAVYLAAYTYELPWGGVLAVMVLVSFLTAGVSRLLVHKLLKTRMRADELLSESVSMLLIILLSCLAVFIILIFRFNLPMALGISILSGIMTAFVRKVIA
jgi:LytS/YehU family sensor histidine kinase